ncbi:MAG: glycosyltransferase family 9 protein [Nanoarchaeota archaeon]
MKILIIKLGAIGDVIRTTSILSGLKAKHKNCGIDWVTKEESLDILKNNTLINRVYTLGQNTVNKLKNQKYDLVVCLDDDYSACELSSGIKPKRIIGAYLKNNQESYTKDSAIWFDMGLLSRFGKQKADALKAKNKKTYQAIMYKILGLQYRKQEPILALDEKELAFAKEFAKKNYIKKTDIVIGINTGASGRWQDKKLSIEKTAELSDKLNREINNVKLILFGGPEEKDRNQKIKKLLKTKIIDAGCNNSLMEFASLVDLCDVIVTSDSLALHIGVALKKKIAAFFGPTSSSEIELYSRGVKIIPKIGCLCCYKPKCDVPPVYEINDIVNSVRKLA